MKSVRILYKKENRMRFMSHLDITRFMARAIRRAKLPIWYTEGFNPHPYITFALPLSLGFESKYEVMDIRLTDDDYNISEIPEKLNAVTGDDITFFDCFTPTMKTGEVFAAYYNILFDDGGELYEDLNRFFGAKNLVVSKKTKRGEEKQLNIKEKIKDLKITKGENTEVSLILPANSELNVNPELVLNAFFEQSEHYYCYKITRISVLNKNYLPFL